MTPGTRLGDGSAETSGTERARTGQDAHFPRRGYYRERLEEAHKHDLCVDEAMAVLDDFAKTIYDLRQTPALEQTQSREK